MKTASLALAVCAVTAASLPALAHDHATGVVKQRMDMMTAMAERMKEIGRRIEARRDLAAIKADAEAIASHAPHIVHLFPAGSTQRPTDARPAIWQDWPDFERKAAALETESRRLAAIGAGDAGALKVQFRAVADTCGGCHEKYRTKKRKGDL